MKRRYLYVLIFGVPALLVSVIISFLLFGAAAGVLWIFVFGDNPWPAFAGKMLTAVFIHCRQAPGTSRDPEFDACDGFGWHNGVGDYFSGLASVGGGQYWDEVGRGVVLRILPRKGVCREWHAAKKCRSADLYLL